MHIEFQGLIKKMFDLTENLNAHIADYSF